MQSDAIDNKSNTRYKINSKGGLGWAKRKDNQWHQNLFRVHGQCTHGKKPLSPKKPQEKNTREEKNRTEVYRNIPTD